MAPIFRLPAELLRQILSYVLTKDHPVKLYTTQDRRWRNELRTIAPIDLNNSNLVVVPNVDRDLSKAKAFKSTLLDLLLVSRQFYFAGTETYFGENCFGFEDLEHLRQFVDGVENERRKWIRRILFLAPTTLRPASGDIGDLLKDEDAGDKDLVYCLNQLLSLKEVTFTMRSGFESLDEQLPAFVHSVMERVGKMKGIGEVWWRPIDPWSSDRGKWRTYEDGVDYGTLFEEERFPWETGWGDVEVLVCFKLENDV